MYPLYFKFRPRFEFSPHRFEIGNAIIQNKGLADNFFLKKLYDLEEEEYGSYYYFHFDYFSKNIPNQEERYFNHVTDIVINRLVKAIFAFNGIDQQRFRFGKRFLKIVLLNQQEVA